MYTSSPTDNRSSPGINKALRDIDETGFEAAILQAQINTDFILVL